MNLMLLLTQINLADTVSAGSDTGELTMSYWNLALKGGWVMIIIAIPVSYTHLTLPTN